MKNLLLVLSLILVFTVNLHSGITIYVKYNATGSNNGTSWTDAYTSFQSALTAAASGDQIWVAKGTYKPTVEIDGTGDRFKTFQMKNGVAIYGGFAGTETAVSQRTNYGVGQTNETILSGDLNDNGKDDNDSYHVFYHPSSLALTNSAVLDGFTIKGGNANSGSDPHALGGGMYNYSSSPTLTNCTFTSNLASLYGGGMCDYSSAPVLTNCSFTSNAASYGGAICNSSSSSPTLTKCSFTSNTASVWGGGIFSNNSSSPILTSCTLTSNSATNYGGAMYNESNSPSITNCTFTSNSAGTGGGGLANGYSSLTLTNCTLTSNSAANGGGLYNDWSSPTLNNCIIWENEAAGNGDEFSINGGGTTTLNYSCYANATGDVYISAGALNDTNNDITSDPQFVGSSTYPYSILGISPCADAGNDSYNTQDYDIRGVGYARKLNKTSGGIGTIDMGAYEYKLNDDLLPVELTSFTASANGTVVTLNWKTAAEINNYGFEIERRTVNGEQLTVNSWQKIGFVKGTGTSNTPKTYSYSDATGFTGSYVYRLKQIDQDGSFKYSQSVEVSISAPEQFALAQNYPNPFNPTTNISFTLPSKGFVSLKVFDMLGREVATIVSEEMSAGSYSKQWNAANISSGIYFYRLQAGSFTETKKLVLLR